jgi:predicted glycosyltransferase
MNSAIIEKALKNASKPDFVLTVDWEEFPTKQIEMLKDVMDIPQDEIVEWYINNIDMSDVVESIKDSIRNRILGEEFHVLQERIKELSEITPKVEPVEFVQTEVKDFKKTKKSTTATKRTTKVKS